MSQNRTATERNEYGLDLFFDNLKYLLSSISSMEEEHDRLPLETIEQASDRLKDAADTLHLITTDVGNNPEVSRALKLNLSVILSNVKILHTLLEQHLDSSNQVCRENAHTCPTAATTGAGRPYFVIDKEQIIFLREMHFSWTKIAELLGVSESTLRRRRMMYDLTEDTLDWTVISDTNLENVVSEIQALTPNIGQTRLMGALRARRIRIQRWRVRECLHKLDPVGTALRWRAPIYRRKYSVPSPNALWHFDGNHKLIRWRLVVHVCMDGYSRLIIYAHCANNNKADTVLDQFVNGIITYGLPSRVRCDYGMENFKVAQFMLEHRGLGRGSVITGSSVHNSRVERAHRDIYSGVLCFFARTFQFLEELGVLDPLNELHLFALHYTYIPRINRCLAEFKKQWSHHPVSTARSMSPMQLFTSGILQNEKSGYAGVEGVLNPIETEHYGIDTTGPLTLDDDNYQVVVPEISCQFTNVQLTALENQCNPLQDDGMNGENVYLQCVSIVSSMV